jgi:16S rRNA (adenine1518-N6/adenine1519-N6)-dimethyltransferase
MNLFSPKKLKNFLRKYQIFPAKRLGQHFLVDKSVLKKIIQAANLKEKDVILEIGPGLGVLTLELAKRVKKVIAIEKDSKMSELLENFLRNQGIKNVQIIKKDILKIKNRELKIRSYKLVANLPYYLTAPIIRKFLEIKNQPKLMVLMVQKEVAQRITAKPPKMNLFSASVQFYAKAEVISFVSENAFWPKPKVESAIIKITPNQKLQKNRELFFKIVRAGFSQPRKQIINNLTKILKLSKKQLEDWLKSCDIKSNQRAEVLNLEDWFCLVNNFDIINQNEKKT